MRNLALFGLVVVTSILTGCASPALQENMVVPATTLSTKSFDASLKKAIVVTDVVGAEKTVRLLALNDFKTALSNSLDNAGLLIPSGKEKYEVTALVSNVELDGWYITMKTTITVDYVVKEARGKEVFKKTVVSQGVATGSDAILATKRLQMAVERTVQSNIWLFIDALAGFKP